MSAAVSADMPKDVRRRASRFVLALVVVAAGALGLVAVRHPLLRTIGRVLAVDDAVTSSDVVIVPVWAGEAGALEAADLVRGGISATVVVVPGTEQPADREIVRRHISYDAEATRIASLLRSLGVEHVEGFPYAAAGTEAEGDMLARWCDERHIRSVVIVSTPDHSRRLRRVLHRAMIGRRTVVSVRAARFAAFDADRWWQSRDGLRTGIVELEKLLLDMARHPFS